jgi:hypothetical protein
MYCGEYQLAQPDCHSRGRSYLRVKEEPVGEPLSYRTQPISGFNGIDTVFCSRFQQLSNVSHSNSCLAVAGNNASGVEAELLRIALAKSQLGGSTDGMLWSTVLSELQNMISCDYMVKKFVHPQSTLVLANNAASSGTTQKGADASAIRFVGSKRRTQTTDLAPTMAHPRCCL